MGSISKSVKKIDPLGGAILEQDDKNMGKITGASAAKKAAAAQAAALEEQTRQAQNQAAETARQAAIQTQQAQAREAATREVEAMQQADNLAAAPPDVQTGATNDVSTSKKRARFQAPASALRSVSL